MAESPVDVSAPPITPVPTRLRALIPLALVFTLSGAAGLIYEIVWFAELQLTIGGSSQSLGVLLACFMGGLFGGSLLAARCIPTRIHPLVAYALIELGIGVLGLGIPLATHAVRGLYWQVAASPGAGLALRCVLCAVLLAPPTLLMGATLPLLSRFVSDASLRSDRVGLLYAVNTAGAVAGVFVAVLYLLPTYGLNGTNLVAVGANVVVAIVSLGLAWIARAQHATGDGRSAGLPPSTDWAVYIACALSGVAAMGFQVLWARLLSVTFGATVYAFGIALGLFLVGLAIGGGIGSALTRRTPKPRRALIDIQLGTAAFAGATALLVPTVAEWFAQTDRLHADTLWVLCLTDLARGAMVVLPAAVLWGMAFPVALASLTPTGGDPARTVGRLYAFNTAGAVAGSLLAAFVVIPVYGSASAAAHLVWLPLAAAIVLVVPGRVGAVAAILIGVASVVAATSAVPREAIKFVREWQASLDSATTYVYLAIIPAFLGFELFLVRRVTRRAVLGGAVTAILLALGVTVPAELYQRGRGYAQARLQGEPPSEIVWFHEGAMEPVVVYRSSAGPLELSVHGQVCASMVPAYMTHLRLLGHLPVLLAADAGDVLVVGLGAGVTAGSAAIHDSVREVVVAELEPTVVRAVHLFADANHSVRTNPKVRIVIDDGRHYVASTRRRFGVITSDPIEPYWAGSAALYTAEYYRLCCDRLTDGGIFMQWLGLYGIDDRGMASLLAAFGEAFPGGQLWISQNEALLVGSDRPIRVDVAAMWARVEADPQVAASFAGVGIESAADLLAHFVCTMADARPYLGEAAPNRDANLASQYVGWRAYYRQSPFVAPPAWLGAMPRRLPADVFIVPDDQRAALEAAVIEAGRRFPRPGERLDAAP